MMTAYTLTTFTQRPDARDRIDGLSDQSWPPFLLHGNITRWHLLFEIFAPYQLLLWDDSDGLMAVGHSVPLVWDGSAADLPATIEEILIRAEQTAARRRTPNAVSAVAAMVHPEHRGKGLSRALVQEMKAAARKGGCPVLIAPVRPTWKSRYPLIPMDRYVEWKRSDGAAFDPWIRVHQRMGAQSLGIAPNTLTVEGTLQEWEAWTGMAFPESGRYVVPGALQPMEADAGRNVGRYEDPNYWMKHDVEP
jgi:GNAT superfamily N-acetyltransferase